MIKSRYSLGEIEMYCEKCGCQISETDNFCIKCGTKIIRDNNKVHFKFRKRKIGKGLCILICLLFVCIAGGIFYKFNDYAYLAVVRNQEGKYGYINEKGKEIIKCQYDYAYSFGKSGLAAIGEIQGFDKKGKIIYKWGFINKKGEIVVPLKYDDINRAGFVEEQELITVAMKDNNDLSENNALMWGFINNQGEEIIECQYADDGLMNYYQSVWSKTGLRRIAVQTGIDQSGKPVLEYGVINRKGDEIIPIGKYCEIGARISDTGLIAAKKRIGLDENGEEINKWGFVNENGNETILFQYDDFGDFGEEGLIAVGNFYGYDEEGERIRKYGYINEKGKEIIPLKFGAAAGFSNGYAHVQDKYFRGNNGGYIDKNGDLVVPYKYNYGYDMDENRVAIVSAWVDEDDDTNFRYGLINSKGEEIVPCEYDFITQDIYNFATIHKELGLYIIMKNKQYGCMNQNGEVVIPVQYDMINGGHNGWIVVGYSNGKYDEYTDTYELHYIDEKGNTVLKLPEKYIQAEGFMKVK